MIIVLKSIEGVRNRWDLKSLGHYDRAGSSPAPSK